MDSLNLDLLDTRNPKEEYKNTVTIAAKNGGTLAIKDPIMVKKAAIRWISTALKIFQPVRSSWMLHPTQKQRIHL